MRWTFNERFRKRAIIQKTNENRCPTTSQVQPPQRFKKARRRKRLEEPSSVRTEERRNRETTKKPAQIAVDSQAVQVRAQEYDPIVSSVRRRYR